ncbi:MAG TPA: Ig-like domain-containing protein [Terriglobales bacterium]|nr:Ig-like domain-containing protein [Terriglobales bacterium]
MATPRRDGSISLLRICFGVMSAAMLGAPVLAQTVERSVEPVVLSGAQIPDWSRLPSTILCAPYPSGTTGSRDAHNGTVTVPPDVRTGVPIDEIAAYRWTGAGFEEIPVQVDERYYYCLSNPASDFAIYSGTDKELTYAWDVESWKKTAGECSASYAPGDGPTPDPVGTLDDDDEIVFMANDAGPQAPSGALPPLGTSEGHGIAVIDPLDPATQRFVYLFRQAGGSSFDSASGYVQYQRHADADEWLDRYSFRSDDPEVLGVSNTGYGPNLPGTVCRTAVYPGFPAVPDGMPRPSTDRFVRDAVTVSTDTYRWSATGRWMVRDLRIAKPGQPGIYGPDLLDRWKGRAFQQSPDSSISLVGFEDEQVNWEANSALLGERQGPVRAIREVWGADSGTNVTKTETFYRDAISYRYHVRVHPIPPDGLYTSWDYNAGVASRYYNILKPDGVAIDGVNDDVGSVDAVFGIPAFFDAPDPTFNVPSAILNWEQVSAVGDGGSLVYILELTGATTAVNPAVVPYYRDDACLDDGTGDDPVPRPWPGEPSTDSRVHQGYSDANGGTPYDQLACEQRQGAWGAHGIHYFFSGDSDNAASPEVLTEIDAQQWQFLVPTSAPVNVGQRYGNVVIAPLLPVAAPLFGLPAVLPPSAAPAGVVTDQGVGLSVVLAGSDVPTCDLTFTIVAPPAHGTLGAITNHGCALGLPSTDTAAVVYTPEADFAGEDSFTYKVNDGLFDSGPATVQVTVRRTSPPTCATPMEVPCRAPVVAGSSPLQLRNRSRDERDSLSWSWTRGAATTLADFGDPTADTHYQLCLFDDAGRTIARASAPAGAQWRRSGAALSYRSGGGRSSLRLKLRPGEAGRARISVRGRGAWLGLALPAEQPVIAQLRNSDGDCWQATYSSPARYNRADRFDGRAD